MAKQHGLYDNSPSIKHEEGKAKVVKTPKSEHGDGSVEKGVKEEGYKESGMPHAIRHAMERRDMHNRHETEHAMHDAHGNGDKKEMHARHEKEMKDMHTRHEKEAGAQGGKEAGVGGATGEPIDKIEKNAKG